MILTGKCKQDFEKWQIEQDWYEDYYIIKDQPVYDGNYHRCINHNELPQSMQYGVLEDFFDSVGIGILINRTGVYQSDNRKSLNLWSHNLELGFNNTRREAQDKAILKANEIHNNR